MVFSVQSLILLKVEQMKEPTNIMEFCSQLNNLKDEYEKTMEETKKAIRSREHLLGKLDNISKEKENLQRELNIENKFER